jgi:hypothetical protein
MGWLLLGSSGVSSYTVHERPGVGATRLERGEELVFVKDGFSWGAALLGPFYFALRGQWLGLLAYIAAAVVLSLVLTAVGAEDDWISWAFLLLNIVAGFEANELKRWSLARAGWREIGTVSGAGLEEAERRFFEAWLPGVPAVSPDHERWLLAGHTDPALEHRFEHAKETVGRIARRIRRKLAPNG